MARLFHRLNCSLLAWLHSWDGEVVRGYPISRTAKHYVEPQMLQAAPGCTAPASTPSYDRHGSSFVLRYETFVGAPRRIQSRSSAGWNLLPLTPKRCETRSPRKYARRTVSS